MLHNAAQSADLRCVSNKNIVRVDAISQRIILQYLRIRIYESTLQLTLPIDARDIRSIASELQP